MGPADGQAAAQDEPAQGQGPGAQLQLRRQASTLRPAFSFWRVLGRPSPSIRPTGRFLASLGGADDNSLVLWEVESGQAVCGSPTHNDFTVVVKFFNRNSKMLVTGKRRRFSLPPYAAAAAAATCCSGAHGMTTPLELPCTCRSWQLQPSRVGVRRAEQQAAADRCPCGQPAAHLPLACCRRVGSVHLRRNQVRGHRPGLGPAAPHEELWPLQEAHLPGEPLPARKTAGCAACHA